MASLKRVLLVFLELLKVDLEIGPVANQSTRRNPALDTQMAKKRLEQFVTVWN